MRITSFFHNELHLFLAAVVLMGCGEEQEPSNPLPGSEGMVSDCVIHTNPLQTPTGLVVNFHPPSNGIPLNELFTLGVTVDGSDDPEEIDLLVDATMPAHGHGMLTMVNIERTEIPNRFNVHQMNLHMPGEWELTALIILGESAQQVRTVVTCAEI